MWVVQLSHGGGLHGPFQSKADAEAWLADNFPGLGYAMEVNEP